MLVVRSFRSSAPRLITSGRANFPITASPTGRYLVDADGRPFPILGRALWYALSLNAADRSTVLDDTAAKGFNAVEIKAIGHDSRNPTVPQTGNGALPFTNRLDGGTWSGALTYTTIGNEAPDFATPNSTYWTWVDTFLNECQARGLLVLMFPLYCGYSGTAQGWMNEMVANGTTKCQGFGSFLANRYAAQKNIMWMLGGDYGTGTHAFSGGESAVESAMITGLNSVAGQSRLYSAEWDSPALATDGTFGTSCNVNGAYSFEGLITTYGSNARKYTGAGSPLPAFALEYPYDEEGPDGTGVNAAATQPVRRFTWWVFLATCGGYMTGNGYVWMFGASWQSHLNTAGAQDLARFNAFIKTVEWWRLLPDGVGGVGTLVTAGGGTIDTTNYVQAACTGNGDLLIAYLGPGTAGSVTIDMTKMRGTTTARWFDPTNGNYTSIGSFANTGTRTFTTTGNNSAGAADWVLRLDA